MQTGAANEQTSRVPVQKLLILFMIRITSSHSKNIARFSTYNSFCLFFSIAFLRVLTGEPRMTFGDQRGPSFMLGAVMLVINLQVCDTKYQAVNVLMY